MICRQRGVIGLAEPREPGSITTVRACGGFLPEMKTCGCALQHLPILFDRGSVQKPGRRAELFDEPLPPLEYQEPEDKAVSLAKQSPCLCMALCAQCVKAALGLLQRGRLQQGAACLSWHERPRAGSHGCYQLQCALGIKATCGEHCAQDGRSQIPHRRCRSLASSEELADAPWRKELLIRSKSAKQQLLRRAMCAERMGERQARRLARETPAGKAQAFLLEDRQFLPCLRGSWLIDAGTEVPAARTTSPEVVQVEGPAPDGGAKNRIACPAVRDQSVAVFVTDDAGRQLVCASQVGDTQMLEVMCDARGAKLQPVTRMGPAQVQQSGLTQRRRRTQTPGRKASPVRVGAQCIARPLRLDTQLGEQVHPSLGGLRDVHCLGIASRATEAHRAQKGHRRFEPVEQRDALKPAANQFVRERWGQESEESTSRIRVARRRQELDRLGQRPEGWGLRSIRGRGVLA